MQNKPVLLLAKSARSGGQAELCARRQIHLLVIFGEQWLRFEGHPGVQTQNCLRSQAIRQNDHREAGQWELNPVVR
jgi:hypothetical protein